MKRYLTLLLVSLVLLLGLWWQVPAGIAGGKSLRGPWDQGPAKPSAPQQTGIETPSPAASLFRLPVIFSQCVISLVDGDRCPSYPTCSADSIEAYERHGALLGTLMTVDRLLHEASEAEFARRSRSMG